MSYVSVGNLLASLVCDRVAIDMILAEDGVSENVRENVREIIDGRIETIKQNRIVDMPGDAAFSKLVANLETHFHKVSPCLGMDDRVINREKARVINGHADLVARLIDEARQVYESD